MIYQANIDGMGLPNLSNLSSNAHHFTCNRAQKLPVMLLTNVGLQNKAVVKMLACRVGILAVRQFDLLAPKEQACVRDFLGGHFSKIQNFLYRQSQTSEIKKRKRWMKLVNSYEVTTAQGYALAKFIQGKAFCCVVAPNNYFINGVGETLLSYRVKMTSESARTLGFAGEKFQTGFVGQGGERTIKVEMISEFAFSQLTNSVMEKVGWDKNIAQIAGAIVALALICFFNRYYYGGNAA